MTSDQEAVCGNPACGHAEADHLWRGACYALYCVCPAMLGPQSHLTGIFEAIPAPVVPSDDEARFRCAGCGVRLRDADLISTSGKGGRRDAHLITGSVPDYCGPVNEVAAAPPTPSQDAEGDGRPQKHYPLRARDTAREAIKIAAGKGGHEHKVQAIANMLIDRDEARESAIREPCEALVEAVGLFIRRATAEECFGCGAPIHHGAGHEVGCAVVSLYVALESPGSRS